MSLKALQTDYIDLYFLHRDNAGIPAGNLLGVLEEDRAKGKLRWYGCSNWSLPRIREAALATQNRLIVEEPEEAAGPAVAPPSAPPPETGPAAADEAALLPDAEYGFLGCLLDGGDWGTFARERSLLPSVLVDSINEKLFDRFGDTVIGYDAERPEVIEDYREELRGMIRK